jgi:hypothetical protein
MSVEREHFEKAFPYVFISSHKYISTPSPFIYMRKTASPLHLDLHREPCFWWGRNRRRARGPESWSMYAFIERSHINTCRFGPSSATSNSPCWSLFCASVSALWSQLVLAASSTLDTPVSTLLFPILLLIDQFRVRFAWYCESVAAIDACPVWYPSVHQYGDNMCVLTTYRMYQRQTATINVLLHMLDS